MHRSLLLIGVVLLPFLVSDARAAEELYKRKQDVVYGRLYGTALTMDVITPRKNANGAAVIWCVSGGWVSGHDFISDQNIKLFFGKFLERGYTIFAVCHGCQPKFTIPEITPQINRAVRFIRFHAADYKIDPNRIAIGGGSAGGHLSVMQGVAPDAENPNSPDPVDKVSSRVQAVGCFFPPTDFLNYGGEGKHAYDHPLIIAIAVKPAFAYTELDPKSHFIVPVTDQKRIDEIEKKMSPMYQVTPDDAPTLLIHGDADAIVPYEQATRFIAKMEEAKVPCKLITKPGKNHGWPDSQGDLAAIADWFDKYLAASPATKPATTAP